MPSQKQIEANRRNARKGTGPKTHAGKARSSHNSFRHGLSATVNDADGYQKIERLRDLLCGEDAGEAEYQLATIVAECQVLIARVRAARVIAIETMRTSAIPPFVPDYVVQQKTDEMLIQLQLSPPFGGTLTQDGVVTHRNGEHVPRNDCESILMAFPQLHALDRYEKRALSRRRRAIERLQAIQHLVKLRRTAGAAAA